MQSRPAQGHPLTINQEALWRFQEQWPSSDAYGMLGVACTRGRPDPGAMRSAYRALLDRYEILRSAIVRLPTGDARCMPVEHGPDTEMLCIDGAAWDGPMLEDFIEQRFARAHLMAGRTLFQAAMVLLPANVAQRVYGTHATSHGEETEGIVGVLVFTAHHVVIDFLSFPVLLRNLEAFYRGDAGHADLHASHAHLASWERDMLAEQATSNRVAAYAGQLRPTPPLLEFGCEAMPGAGQTCSELRFRFPDDARAMALRFASAVGVTPFAVMLAVFLTMVHLQTGSEDICVAIPTHGRARRRFLGSVGYFANVVPLRERLDTALTFRAFARRTSMSLRAALRLAVVPFPVLAGQAGAPEVAPGRSALSQIGFVWDAMPATAPDAWVDLLRVEQRGTPYALCLTGYVSDVSWEFGLKHDASVVPLEVAQQWPDELARLTSLLCMAPDVALGALALVKAPAWHAGAPTDAPGLSIDAALRARARKEPERVILSQGERRIRASELETLTRRMACALLRRLPAGSRLGLLTERGCDGVLAMVAAFRAGVAYVPLHPCQTDAWLAQACERSGVRLVACSAALAERAAGLDRPVWQIDAWASEDALDFEDAEMHSSPSREAYVIHTSGSTGAPKGVGVSHGSLECMLRATRFIYDEPDQRWTLLHHPAFDFAVWEMWGPLVHGQALVIVDDMTVADPSALHAVVFRERITHMGMTPAACRLMLPFLARAGRGELRTLCLGGAAVDQALARELARHGIETWSFYGPTEATVWVTCGRIRGDTPDGWIGMPFAGMRTYVLDRRLQWVPEHRTGDLYLAGPQLAQYPCDPALSAERFVPDPWHPGERMYRTSDRARYTAGSGLQFVGREDRQVKINGYRVELDGLAALLRAEGFFEEVTCVHLPSEGLVAFYTTASASPLDRDTLESLAARALPSYVLPVRFAHRTSMPLNRNSKHDLSALIASLSPPTVSSENRAGELPWIEVILDILRSELGLESAAPDTAFNELGAQSIALARLHGRLARSVPGLQLEDLYVHPTPRSLARRLAFGSAPSLLRDEAPRKGRRRVPRRTPG